MFGARFEADFVWAAPLPRTVCRGPCHMCIWGCSYRVIRVQGELVGDFLETDISVLFMTSFQYFSKSLNLFLLRIIFPYTLKYKESIGASLMSVASL